MASSAGGLGRGLREACLCGVLLVFPWGGCGATAGGSSPHAGDDSASRTASPFGSAVKLDAAVGKTTSATGSIGAPQSVVVFAAGPLAEGESLRVRVIAATRGFDPAVAVFDADGNWIDLNDNGGAGTSRLDCGVDFAARSATAQTFVVVSSSAQSDTVGEFSINVERSDFAEAAETPAGQRIYLNFAGGSGVQIGGRPAVDVPEFSGELLDPAFAASTREIEARVTARVRGDLAGLDVEVYASNEDAAPPQPYSTVYFGSYDAALLGVADSVDVFNAAPEQDAIVFVDTFAVFAALDPTVEEISDALGNVASHEIGHLLGLHHTADPTELMDITASLSEMLVPQRFGRAPLNADTFPAGYQDAPELLHENVGGTLRAAAAFNTARRMDETYRKGAADSARGHLRFGTACR